MQELDLWSDANVVAPLLSVTDRSTTAQWLTQRRRVHRKAGVAELGILKATTVHQEFRVPRRVFSVAVKKKLCPVNPCTAVEFPVRVKGLFRPHYVTWSEQMKIEKHASAYLRNVIQIITETGLRVYKELAAMKKEQVDLANKVVFIAESKTPTGVAEVPLTDIAVEAFCSQIELAGPDPGCSRARATGRDTKPNSRRPGKRPSGRQVSPTSGSTTSVPRTPRG